MDFVQTLSSTAESFDIIQFSINILLTIIFSFSLSYLFQRFSLSFSDRRRLASTFVLLAVATMCVISVVKSSLALSLGLVGALSIVRFRTAIKEPEELVFLFLNIVVGIAFGANQVVIGTAVFVVSSILIIIRYMMVGKLSIRTQFAHLIVGGTSDPRGFLDSVEQALDEFSTHAEIRRVDSNETHSEVVMDVAFNSHKQMESALASIRDKGYSVTYIANSGD